MLLDPADWTLAQRIDTVLPALSPELAAQRDAPRRTARRSSCATGVHAHASPARSTSSLRCAASCEHELEPLALRAACAGTHPFAVWHETVVSGGERYQLRLRLDARAGAARADLRAARARRRARRRERDPRCATGCAPTCRCCSRCRPTRPSGRAATPASPRRARRSSRPSRASASRAPSTATPTTSRRSTC